jgi:hypothetical protein
MTERKPKLQTRTVSLRLIAASLAAAGAIFGGLAVQMAHGHDPALGAGTASAQTSGSSGSTGSSGDQSTAQDQFGSPPSSVVTRAS